jgi:hypothetical protein
MDPRAQSVHISMAETECSKHEGGNADSEPWEIPKLW